MVTLLPEQAKQEYKINIYKIELCDSSSTASACNGAVTIFDGNSGDIDIANTTAGAAAASLGNASAATFGTAYTYLQITMGRDFTVKGSAADDSGTTCYTKSDGSAAGRSIHTINTDAEGPMQHIIQLKVDDPQKYAPAFKKMWSTVKPSGRLTLGQFVSGRKDGVSHYILVSRKDLKDLLSPRERRSFKSFLDTKM